MRRKWIVVAACAGALTLASASFLASRARRAESAPPARKAEPLPPEASFPGLIRATLTVPVFAEFEGAVESVLASPGDEVAEGQVLATISNPKFEAEHEQAMAAAERAETRASKLESGILAARLEASRARADATRARSEYERAQKNAARQQMLHREGATPRLVYERAQREFEDAEAEFRSLDELARQAEQRVTELNEALLAARKTLEEARAELEESNTRMQAAEVRAPITGFITARAAEAEKELGPDEASRLLFQIAPDISVLEVLIDPPPPVLERIKPGQPALVLVAEVPDPLAGQVREIEKGQAVVEFRSPSPVIRPGQTAQVRLDLVAEPGKVTARE